MAVQIVYTHGKDGQRLPQPMTVRVENLNAALQHVQSQLPTIAFGDLDRSVIEVFDYDRLWDGISERVATIHVPEQLRMPDGEDCGSSIAGVEREANGRGILRSPRTGCVYFRPTPDDPPFVSSGREIEAGTTLCVIESRQFFYSISADAAVRIEKPLVPDGEFVRIGQPLFAVALNGQSQ